MKKLLTSLEGLFPAICHEQIFLVGGSVRDFLLDSRNDDIDLVAALPDELLQQCGFHLVRGKTTEPVWFRYDRVLGKIEITQLDSDTSLEHNLRQRDFTINAMAMGLSGELHDPLNGQDDLRNLLLRNCSENSFLHDPLRIFRAFRFESSGWRMTPETEELLRNYDWRLKLQSIPVERFSREMLKAFSAREPERFFYRMLEFSIGTDWLGELFRMPHIPAGPLEHHPEGDLLSHSVQVLQRAALQSNDPLTRFCAFFHDIGKIATDPALYPKHHGHEEAGFELAINFCNRLCLPASYRKALSWTSRLHMQLNKWDQLRDGTRIRTADQAIKAGIATILPIVSSADKTGNTTPAVWEQALEIAVMATARLGIESETLSAMPIKNRSSFIMQKRVEVMRDSLQQITEGKVL